MVNGASEGYPRQPQGEDPASCRHSPRSSWTIGLTEPCILQRRLRRTRDLWQPTSTKGTFNCMGRLRDAWDAKRRSAADGEHLIPQHADYDSKSSYKALTKENAECRQPTAEWQKPYVERRACSLIRVMTSRWPNDIARVRPPTHQKEEEEKVKPPNRQILRPEMQLHQHRHRHRLPRQHHR